MILEHICTHTCIYKYDVLCHKNLAVDNALGRNFKQHGDIFVSTLVQGDIGLFVTAAILSVFISSHGITTETNAVSDKNENGVFAMQILSRDLQRSYYFAQASGDNREFWRGVPGSVNGACIDSAGNGPFPKGSPASFRALWGGKVVVPGFVMACLDDGDNSTELTVGNDYIVISRARGFPQKSDFKVDRYYLEIGVDSIQVKAGSDPSLGSQSAWEYVNHVYFIDKKDNIPRLRRLTLTTAGILDEGVVAEGIENMQILYGVDAVHVNQRDGAIDKFLQASDLSVSDWDTGRIIALQIFLLVRAIKPTAGYNGQADFQLGAVTVSTANNDNYKRQVLSRVIKFTNSSR